MLFRFLGFQSVHVTSIDLTVAKIKNRGVGTRKNQGWVQKSTKDHKRAQKGTNDNKGAQKSTNDH